MGNKAAATDCKVKIAGKVVETLLKRDELEEVVLARLAGLEVADDAFGQVDDLDKWAVGIVRRWRCCKQSLRAVSIVSTLSFPNRSLPSGTACTL